MYRRVLGISAVSSIAALIFLPDSAYPQSLRPVAHMLNVANAGVKIAYVYKFSSKDTHEKHLQASGYLRDGLRKSGGIYIKLGQLIATLDVIVPDEYRTTMTSLTRGCEKSSFQQVRTIVENQLQKPLEEVFSKFQTSPISSASIGQVHKAVLKKTGEEVAVKVQHAGLAENVDMDLKLMRGCVSIAKMLFDDFKYGWLIEEFDKNIHRELDFKAEAANLLRVGEMLKKQKMHNATVPRILLPPSQKMLVMEFINGCHIDEIQAIKAKGINAKNMGKLFSEIIVKMIHKFGFVHADPHSGNILVRKDRNNKDQMVLLDHGLYQQLDENIRHAYNRFWLGLILNNEEMYVKAASELGTKNGVLLCCMLTSQTRDQLAAPERNIFDLNPSTDKEVVLRHATEWHQQIVQVLNELRRQVLLLLKVNQFARAIENMLGGRQMGVYEDIAKNCVQNLPYSRWQKYKFFWNMYYARRR